MAPLCLCLLAVVLPLGFAAAATPQAGCNAQGGTAGLYVNSTVACAKAAECTTAFNDCLTGSFACTKATECVHDRLKCLNAASEDSTCAGLNDLHMSLLNVAGGALFNSSTAYKSCVATSCHWMNMTFGGQGGQCTLEVEELCRSPVKFVGSMMLKGDFSGILNDPEKLEKFRAALERDLARFLGILGVRVTRLHLTTRTTKRADGFFFVVEFEVPVSIKNTGFALRFEALKTQGCCWLQEVESGAVYAAETGKTLIFTTVAEGSSSQAFPSFESTDSPAPATPARTPPSLGDDVTTVTSAANFQSLSVAVAIVGLSLMLS